MPSYTLADITVNAALTNVSIAYIQEMKGFVHHKAFATLPVEEETFRFFEFDRGDTLRTDAGLRAPGTVANRKTIGMSLVATTLVQQALDMQLPDEHRTTKDSPFSEDAVQAELITHDLMIRRELDWAAVFMATAVWTAADNVGTTDFTKWSDASPTISSDVRDWKEEVKKACGWMPNVAVVTQDVWDTVAEDSTIVDRIKHTSKEVVTPELVAGLWELDEVLVMASVQNTANEGATVTGAYIESDKVLLAYRPPNPGKRVLSAGYNFSWTPYDLVRGEIGTSGAPAILTWRNDEEEADYFRGKMYNKFKITAGSAGILARDVL